MHILEKSAAPLPADVPRPARLVLTVLGVWLFLGLFMGVQFYLNATAAGKPASLGMAIWMSVQKYLIYAGLTLPVLWLCRRYPPTSKRWVLPLSVHLLGVTVFVALYVALRLLFRTVVDRNTLQPLPASWETAQSLVRSNLFELFTMYATIAIAALALQYYRQGRQRDLREAELKQKMAEYELQVLKLQLHPHFLFNAMNGISTLMSRDVKTAQVMLVRLSELLRMALSHSTANEVSLRDEIEFVKAYLEIERMRFGDRLRVEMKIDQASLDARVPNMMIQPLVENGIHYGIARIRSGGSLELATRRADGRLRIVIVNDGPLGSLEKTHRSGVGLGNARSRLVQLYGSAYELRLLDRPQGGAELHLDIPFRGPEGGAAGEKS
ncbi:MAG TPA: histidine kinase [Candidatus Polarisedimenticolia bacterium]|jgi:sensor histidine kinase YesM|nr:histidine kinase [Candidatus Polarisedimenticolia bacterium]